MKWYSAVSHSIGLLLFVCGWFVAASSSAAAQTSKEKPVAVVGEESFYEKDYLPQIQSQLNELRDQEYQLKRKALEQAINQRLLRAEAKKQGITEEELLKREVDSKVAKPTQEERDQAIVARMFGMDAQSNVVGDQFDKDLQQEKMQQAREDYFQSLREQAGVKIYLLPAPIAVGFDPARVRGNPDAKITMIEFSDYQCPFCLQAYTTVKNILKKYNGKVRLAYRDLPLLPIAQGVPGSAEAARCAGEQGKFWEYHDLLFENQDSFGEAAFKEFGESLQLNAEQFASCLASGKFKAPVQQDFQEGIRLGIKGTPAFFINGVMVSGAQPQSEFEEIIDAELFTME